VYWTLSNRSRWASTCCLTASSKGREAANRR
jgi:hypothetical protein